MTTFKIWISFDLKIEYVIENNIISISLLVRENRHIDIWKKIRLNRIHLKKLVKTIKESLDTIKKNEVSF